MHSPFRSRIVIATAAATLVLAACGDDSATSSDADTPSAETAAAAGVAVDVVWARSSPAMARAGAVYLTVSNPGTEPDALIGATVDASVAARIELHETVADGGHMAGTTPMGQHGGDASAAMMMMQPVDRVEIAAGATATLAPGGDHLMVFDLVEPLEVGDRFEVTLSFERAGDVTVTADVRDSAP